MAAPPSPPARHPLAHLALYAVLRVPPSASQAEIKIAYRSLILQAHPDRQGGAQDQSEGSKAAGAEELNAAYEVLRDERTRGEWEKARAAYLAAQRAPPSSNPSAFALSLSLDLFDAHYAPSSQGEEDEEEEPAWYTHPCRCSSQFRITREQLEEGVEVVTCEGCSERCRVEYEVVEE
ncbi:hypothetical protein JCM10213_006001 [Rhodosporidiobolus nylandii]